MTPMEVCQLLLSIFGTPVLLGLLKEHMRSQPAGSRMDLDRWDPNDYSPEHYSTELGYNL